MNNSQNLKLTVHWRRVHTQGGSDVNGGVTPSRAECAGVPLGKMPPPFAR